jgi:hypothetical protein
VLPVRKFKNVFLAVILLTVLYCSIYHGTKYYIAVRADRAVPPQAYLHHYIHNTPYIEGPPEFREDVKKALATIQKVSPEQYEEICSYAVIIRQINSRITKSGVAWADTLHNQIYISNDLSVELNPYQLLTTLVHESKHLSQNQHMDAEQKEREAVLAEKTLLVALDVDHAIIKQLINEQRFESRWWEEERKLPASQ